MATTAEPSPQPDQPSTASITVTTAPPSAAQNGDEWPAPPPAHSDPWLTFPPFPNPPPGVELIPFSAFKPTGIQVAIEPAEPGFVERDGLGIPTVTLRVHHDLTAMERRKRKKTAKVGADGVVRRAIWYEEWAEGEELRRTAGVIDPSLPRIDRLHQAAYDFKQGRPLHANQELSQLWDRWRLYLGLISGMQPPATRKKNSQMRDALAAMAEAGDDDDDDEEEEMPATRPPKQADVVVTNDENIPAKAAPAVQPSKPFFTEEQREQRREYFREVRDTKADRFLNDPETAVKIFLSGYYRDRGMIFSEKYCRDGPILLNFFINFLLRNRVFPESEKDLRKALAVTEQAQKELPHSFVVSRTVPDEFSQGCELLFGTKTHTNIWQDVDQGTSGDEGEPDAKRQKVDGPIAPTVLQEAAGFDKIEVVTPDTMEAMEKDAREVRADASLNGEEDPSEMTWGTEPAPVPADANADAPSWGDMNAAWSAPEDPDVWDTTPKSNPLGGFLGATALPLTHTTGIVERSTRRVKAIIPPPPHAVVVGKKKARRGATQAGDGPDAAAVERDLEERFAQVVLIPWHEWDLYDKADVTKPRILPESRGPAIKEEDEVVETEEGAPKPHNPFKDEITLLVEPAAAQKLLLGIGIEATWIQLARADPSVFLNTDADTQQDTQGTADNHASASVEPTAPTKYWYMEQTLAVLPSFHTEMVPLPTTEDVFGAEAQ